MQMRWFPLGRLLYPTIHAMSSPNTDSRIFPIFSLSLRTDATSTTSSGRLFKRFITRIADDLLLKPVGSCSRTIASRYLLVFHEVSVQIRVHGTRIWLPDNRAFRMVFPAGVRSFQHCVFYSFNERRPLGPSGRVVLTVIGESCWVISPFFRSLV